MMKKLYLIVFALQFFVGATWSQDQNFHIYLCFGQSNMEGHSRFEARDTIDVSDRFKVMAAVDCSGLSRSKGSWYTAVPPLCRCRTGLTPADYFGRTLLEKLPSDVKVGVINVSIGGCRIELFDKDNYQTYVDSSPDWLKNMVKEYEGNPYGRLVEMAKLAQKDGVIKGILMHQGESNTGDEQWPLKVKAVYESLLADLGLNSNEVPLLAGEVLGADQNGKCASMNAIIAKLPQYIPNSAVVSSFGCQGIADGLHFSAEGYRELGRRYAEKMLEMISK